MDAEPSVQRYRVNPFMWVRDTAVEGDGGSSARTAAAAAAAAAAVGGHGGAAGESDDKEEEVEEEPGSGDAGSDAESDGVEPYDEFEGDE